MIRVTVDFAGTGAVRRVRVDGHAAYSEKENLPCGLVSGSVRSFARVLQDSPRVKLSGRLPRLGEMEIKIESVDESASSWYEGVSELLLRNLVDAAADYPEDITVDLK